MAEKSLYEKLWSSGKDVVKNLNKPIAKRKDKRAFKGAYDNADEKGDSAKKELNEILEKEIGNYGKNITEIVLLKKKILAADETKEVVKELYKEVFGEDFRVDE